MAYPSPRSVDSTYLNRETSSTIWEEVGTAEYGGMGEGGDGPIVRLSCIAWISNELKTYDLRVIDFLNGGVVIAEVTGLSNTSPSVIDLGTINEANLPTDTTILELQAKRESGGFADVFIQTLRIMIS